MWNDVWDAYNVRSRKKTVATGPQVEEYKKVALDVEAVMKAGIAASTRPNLGFSRSTALTDASSIV